MADADLPERWIDEVAARAEGAEPDESLGAHPEGPSLADARFHLDQAWEQSSAGTELPPTARLRQVKRAVNLALRPVTSHQVPFNRELVEAVDRLARVVEEIAGQVAGSDQRVVAATARIQAALATVELGYDDIEGTTAELGGRTDDLTDRLAALEVEVVAQRTELRAARSREELVLRTIRDAAAEAVDPSSALARESALADTELLRRLSAAAEPSDPEARARVADLIDAVRAAPQDVPVLDLASRGPWLDALDAAGLEATGVSSDPDLAARLRARGHTVAHADPLTHLSGRPAGALGAVTAAGLADRLPLADLVALVDAAREALRPGGVLVLEALNPTAVDDGATELWADPTRRPLHPRTLELLVLDRGFAEVDLHWTSRGAGLGLTVAGADTGHLDTAEGAAAADAVARLDAILASPRAYAVVARAPGGTGPRPGRG